jgi:oligopeptide transport system substrate-binding protein
MSVPAPGRATRRRGADHRPLRRALIAAALLLASTVAWSASGPAAQVRAASKDEVSILATDPTTLDPAAQGDVESAALTAQLFESLTAFDPSLTLRPALAASWAVGDGGRRFVFHLRPGLTFSDGTPLTASDVVRSWLRLVDRSSPSPLASLMADVVGATAYLRGDSNDPASVGLKAIGDDVDVQLSHPAADFVSVVAGPSFGVVPPGNSFGSVTSGGYRVSNRTDTELTLSANDHYWAGRPAISTIHLKTATGGRSPVDLFDSGDIDYTPVSALDASWIGYDRELGRELRSVPSLSVSYLGFDTRRPPFNDVRVRRAFALAVDWQRLVALSGEDRAIPATSMVPPGIPDRSGVDFAPHSDPGAARAALAQAGFPGGAGFPTVTYASTGLVTDEGMLRQLHDVLGVTVAYESLDSLLTRLSEDPPAMWSLGWIADYPGQNDFLGILLGSGASNNYSRWSSPEFDAAIAEAGAADGVGAAQAAYDRAQMIVRRDVPVIPVSYGPGYALSRDGLLGAGQNGLGFVRMAGLAWVP